MVEARFLDPLLRWLELEQAGPEVAVTAVLLLSGLALGLAFLGGRLSARSSRVLRRRVRELEAQLESSREELSQARDRLSEHRAEVEKHFEQTSALFGQLTRQYTALYGHLAEGVRAFSPQASRSLASGPAPPLLHDKEGAPAAGPEPEPAEAAPPEPGKPDPQP